MCNWVMHQSNYLTEYFGCLIQIKPLWFHVDFLRLYWFQLFCDFEQTRSSGCVRGKTAVGWFKVLLQSQRGSSNHKCATSLSLILFKRIEDPNFLFINALLFSANWNAAVLFYDIQVNKKLKVFQSKMSKQITTS